MIRSFFFPFGEQTVEVFVLTLHNVFRHKGRYWHIVEGNPRVGVQHPHVLETLLPDLIQILRCILVFSRFHGKVELAVSLVGLVKTICLRNIPIQLLANSQSGLVCPESGNIMNRVPTTSKHH